MFAQLISGAQYREDGEDAEDPTLIRKHTRFYNDVPPGEAPISGTVCLVETQIYRGRFPLSHLIKSDSDPTSRYRRSAMAQTGRLVLL